MQSYKSESERRDSYFPISGTWRERQTRNWFVSLIKHEDFGVSLVLLVGWVALAFIPAGGG